MGFRDSSLGPRISELGFGVLRSPKPETQKPKTHCTRAYVRNAGILVRRIATFCPKAYSPKRFSETPGLKPIGPTP